MATQLSAVTLIGTTGQGAIDGMRFVQFYFGLPLAMVILGVTLVPFLTGAKVYTAYEFLERRFDAKTRSLTAFLFYCRADYRSVLYRRPCRRLFRRVRLADFLVCGRAGRANGPVHDVRRVQAVAWADVKQMALVSFAGRVHHRVAGAHPGLAQRRIAGRGSRGAPPGVRFSFDLTKTYTFWAGLIGGTFLMFGTSAPIRASAGYPRGEIGSMRRAPPYSSVRTGRFLAALVLLVGVPVFVFYLFREPPLFFNPT